MDTTYEQKGAKRVAINQNGPTLGKRVCVSVCAWWLFLRLL